MQNRVSFFRKLINWLKILLWTGETEKRNWQLTLGYGGILGVESSMG